jgi:hypothetical protein
MYVHHGRPSRNEANAGHSQHHVSYPCALGWLVRDRTNFVLLSESNKWIQRHRLLLLPTATKAALASPALGSEGMTNRPNLSNNFAVFVPSNRSEFQRIEARLPFVQQRRAIIVGLSIISSLKAGLPRKGMKQRARTVN